MKYRKILIFLSIAFLSLSGSTWSVEKNNIQITRIDNSSIAEIRVQPLLSAADTCIVRHDQGIVYKLGGWVEGNELYKSYLDPSLTCTDPYPFTITEIIMPMEFDAATTLTVAVDIEKVDYSDPTCPFPDTIMLGISSLYSLSIPENGLYNIYIPFDEPVIVNEPFFAGFFIGDIDTNNIPYLITDDNLQSICMSYNAWDDSIGFVDLMNYDFPGQLVLYASGIPSGVPLEPEPIVAILSPSNNANLYKSTEIWVDETSGSQIIDYVSFSYSSGSDFIEIAIDYDGTKAFRDGMTQGNNANGYSINWDFSTVPEGTYTLRVTAVDTLGRTASDEISIFLEPTPPIAEIITPSLGANFCPQFDILMSSNDDNLVSVTLDYKRSEPNFSVNAQTLLLSNFGDYYSSAIAASLAMQALHDRGDANLMELGINSYTPTQLVHKLADNFSLVSDSGAYDENIFKGLLKFNYTVGFVLTLNYQRSTDYLNLRTEIELNGKVVMAGLGGTSNSWVLIDGLVGTAALDGTYQITISNPINALIDTVQLRNAPFGCEIFYNGGWQPIEVTINIGTNNWTNELIGFGFDLNRADGWSYNWTPPNLWQGYDYFIQSKGTDQTSLYGYYTTMISYDCTQFYIVGDFNNDGNVDLTDLNYLIDYFINQGAPPVGGDSRADTNCDGYLNITDIIYYANFIFGLAPEPCY